MYKAIKEVFLCAGQDSVTHRFLLKTCATPPHAAALRLSNPCSRYSKTPARGVLEYRCAGQDSNLRRPKSRGLQPRAFDHSATDATVHSMPYFPACYNICDDPKACHEVCRVVSHSLFIAPSLVFTQQNILQGRSCRKSAIIRSCKSVCDLATLAQNVLNTGIYVAVFLSAILSHGLGGCI